MVTGVRQANSAFRLKKTSQNLMKKMMVRQPRKYRQGNHGEDLLGPSKTLKRINPGRGPQLAPRMPATPQIPVVPQTPPILRSLGAKNKLSWAARQMTLKRVEFLLTFFAFLGDATWKMNIQELFHTYK